MGPSWLNADVEIMQDLIEEAQERERRGFP